MELIEGGKPKTKVEELIEMYHKELEQGDVKTAGALVGSCLVGQRESPIDMCRFFLKTTQDLRDCAILQELYEVAIEEEEQMKKKMAAENEIKKQELTVLKNDNEEEKD